MRAATPADVVERHAHVTEVFGNNALARLSAARVLFDTHLEVTRLKYQLKEPPGKRASHQV